MKHPTILPVTLILITLTNCSIKEQPNQQLPEAKKLTTQTTYKAISEEQVVMLKAPEYVDIGTTPKEIIAKLKQVRNYVDLLKYIKDRGMKNNRHAKELDFKAFLLIEDIWTTNDLRINLCYIVQNDSVKYGLISSIDSNYVEKHGKIEFVREKSFLTDYVAKHNALYKTNKQNQDFINEVIKQNHVVNIAAGMSANWYGDREKKLFKAINRLDYSYVLNLLTSMNLENQTLGIIGMEKLSSKGVKIDEHTNKIIKHLKTRNSFISCSITCVGGKFKLSRYLGAYEWDKIPNIEIK